MNKRKTHTVLQLGSAVFMILALLWLTVSAPFVFASQQEFAKHTKLMKAAAPLSGTEEETQNPLGNSTEEKNSKSSNSSFSEEYLHDHHTSEYFFTIASLFHNCENVDTYIAFHGELLVPPPNPA